MKNLKVFEYKNTSIEFEVIDGEIFANATLMCQAFGKKPIKWLELDSTKRYLEAVKVKSDFRTSLIETRRGNSSDFSQGTWIHEKLILKLAQWLDVEFELWCDEKVAELLKTGRTSIQPANMDMEDILIAQLQNMKAVRIEQEQIKNRLELVEARTTTRPDYFTILGYAVYNKVSVNLPLAAKLGRQAKSLCEKRGLMMDKVPDPRFGFVYNYPREVLDEVFNKPMA